MKKLIAIIAGLLIVIGIVIAFILLSDRGEVKELTLDESFTLEVGERGRIVDDGFTINIELLEVTDNRCIGEDCLSPGEFNAVLRINGREYEFGSEFMQWIALEGIPYTVLYLEEYTLGRGTFVINAQRENEDEEEFEEIEENEEASE